MKRSVFTLLAVLLLLIGTVSVFAQEQTGGIEGVVRDSSGAVLPGVTVEASSSGTGTVSTVTDSNGMYRFPRLPSGRYQVKASLMGYNTGVSNAEVTLGKIATVNVSLGLAAVAESITVTAEAPIVDVTQSATSTSIAREQLEFIPKGRDFTSVVAQAAGASNEGFAGGISIDGASGSENRFVIDGVDTTHPQNGLSGQNLITDFVEEVQVKTAGYAAEFGGSIGGVINAVTKSGTNDFMGSVGMYYGDRSWDGEERPAPAGAGTYLTYNEDDIVRIEPFLSFGGPIIRDRLWFFIGASQSEFSVDRTPFNPLTSATGPTKSQTDTREYYTGNIKGNLGSKFLFKVAGSMSPRTVEGILPRQDAGTPATTNLAIDNEFETTSYSAYADFIPTSSFYLSGRAGHYETDTTTLGLPPAGTPRIFFRNGTIPLPTTDPRYRPEGFATIPGAGHSGTEFDLWERDSGSFDANYFFTGFGQHSIKGGVQYETILNDVSTGEIGNLFEVRWGLPDRLGLGVIGQYGSVHVRRFGTFGAVESQNLGFYLQDSWQVIPNLTLNIGVRTEQEKVPNYGFNQDPSLPEYAFEFGYDEKLAPRLGFSWNVFNDERLKVYGSWGKYFDIMKLQMSRGSFGGDRWIGYVYPLNTLNWETLPTGCQTATNDPSFNPCPALGTPRTIDLRHPTDPSDPLHGVDPDLKPMEQEEIQLGAEHLVTRNSSVGVRYVNKRLIAAIEDIGFFACSTPTQCEESYFVGNPGLGATAADPAGPLPASPKAKRDYEAIELSYNRRFTGSWSARLGYTYSSLEGNWGGLGASDEFGRTDPNVSRSFDAIHNSFDMNGKPVYGPLNTDRPHVFDGQFLYRAPFQTSFGVNQYYGSGTPISTQVTYAGVPFYPFGRGDQGRTDALMQTDLMVSHPITFGPVALELSLNVLNLFDSDTVLLADPFYSNTDVCSSLGGASGPTGCNNSAEWFFNNLPTNLSKLPQNNPYYLKPNTVGSTATPYQDRRTVRLGVRLTF